MVAVLLNGMDYFLSRKDFLPIYGSEVSRTPAVFFFKVCLNCSEPPCPRALTVEQWAACTPELPMWLAEGKLNLHQSSTSSSTNPALTHSIPKALIPNKYPACQTLFQNLTCDYWFQNWPLKASTNGNLELVTC